MKRACVLFACVFTMLVLCSCSKSRFSASDVLGDWEMRPANEGAGPVFRLSLNDDQTLESGYFVAMRTYFEDEDAIFESDGLIFLLDFEVRNDQLIVVLTEAYENDWPSKAVFDIVIDDGISCLALSSGQLPYFDSTQESIVFYKL